MSSIARDALLNEDADRPANKGKSHAHNDNDRTRSPSAIGDEDLKHEDGGPDVRMADAKPTYKSWKKKYRKMRIKFDQLQAQNEELYQLEQKALKKTKQLAIYNDRILDVLLDINNRPQIPTEKRFDLSLPIPSDADDEAILHLDKEPRPGPQPAKSLKDLINDVPHLDFTTTVQRFPDVANELLTGIDSPAADASRQQHPPSFLTADDIDNYLWEIDVQAAAEPEVYGDLPELLPTLAPLAREQNGGMNAIGRGATPSAAPHPSAAGASSISTSSRDFALRNPTSVYNWLRKHAPKTFLQDHEGGEDKKEKGGEKASRKAHRVEDDDDDEESRPPAKKGAGSARKASGEGRASTGAARAKGERGSKAERSSRRSTAAQGKDKRKSMDETMYDLDDELGMDRPGPASGKGKRKRAVVDDTGYRPKGGSSRRPAKKRAKNHSLGGASAGGAGGEDVVVKAMQAEIAAAKKKQAEAAAAGAEAED